MARVSVELPEDFTQELSEVIQQSINDGLADIKKQTEFPEYMKVEQAAQFLNVSRTTLTTKYIPAGLPVMNIDSLQRISKRACIEFMNQHQI